ncbi:MAG: hypothetical protein AAB316_23805 [Bacteroidota bacterium]
MPKFYTYLRRSNGTIDANNQRFDNLQNSEGAELEKWKLTFEEETFYENLAKSVYFPFSCFQFNTGSNYFPVLDIAHIASTIYLAPPPGTYLFQFSNELVQLLAESQGLVPPSRERLRDTFPAHLSRRLENPFQKTPTKSSPCWRSGTFKSSPEKRWSTAKPTTRSVNFEVKFALN